MTIAEHDITATLQELAADFDLNSEELNSFVDAEMNYSSSAIRSTGLKLKPTSPSDIRGKVTRIPASFSGKLSSEKQSLIRRLYPDFEVTFKQEKVQSHAAAACARSLDRLLLKKRVPAGLKIVSVGGNYEHELLTSDVLVHSCTPDSSLVDDAKEAAREVQRMSRLRAMAAGKGCSPEKMRQIREFIEQGDDSPWRCKQLVQNCKYRAGAIVMAHVYDMTLEQMMQAMISHGSQMILGCILFSNDMLDSKNGRLPSVDGYYRIDDRGRITYGFDNESQWEYAHSWEELRRFAFGGTVVQVGTRRAFYSITEKRGDTLFFTMTLAPVKAVVRPVVKSWKSEGGKRAIVHGYKLSDTDRSSEANALVPTTFSYPYDTFVKSLAYAIERMDKGSFKMEDLQRKVRAITADTTINAVRISGADRMDDDQLAYFLSNVGVLAAMASQLSASDEHVILDGVRITRGCLSQSLLAKGCLAVRKICGQPFPNDSAAFRLYRRLANAFSAAEDVVLGKISWETDFGYRDAIAHPSFTLFSRRTAGDPSGDLTSAEPSADEVMATLMSAARDSLEFALVLAEAAAKMHVDPRYETWATSLRARFDVKVNADARRAERVARQRAEDPGLSGGDASTTAVDDEIVTAGVRATTGDAGISPSPELDASRMAADAGVTLEPTDELSYDVRSVAEQENVANAAIAEAIFLIEAEEAKVLGECRTGFSQVSVNGLPCHTKLNSHAKLNFNPDFWMVSNGILSDTSWLGRSVKRSERHFPYAAVYHMETDTVIRVTTRIDRENPECYVHVVLDGEGSAINGLVMTAKYLGIFNGPVIISNMRSALRIPLQPGFSLNFVEGVPGCGKTHYIIHSAKPNDSIIACGRENADTTRCRIIAHGDSDPSVLEFRQPAQGVRTLDSALMFPTVGRKGAMFLDECFQDHAGKFWAVMKLWRASTVQALGDRQQIPYIDRNYTGKCVLPRLSHWSLRVGKYVSRRCPRDAVMAISRFYGWKIRTTSTVTSSLTLKLNSPIVPNLPGWKYLTMYQDDKQILLQKGFTEVSTVGEVQGQTYERVAVVRIQEKLLPLFESHEQVDVALSRHTKEFIYYAPDDRNDLLTKLVKEAKGNLALVDKFGDVSTAGKPIFDV